MNTVNYFHQAPEPLLARLYHSLVAILNFAESEEIEVAIALSEAGDVEDAKALLESTAH